MASVLVILSVFIFDLIAFGLAIGAEQRRSTAQLTKDAEQDYDYCVYDSDIATGLGVGALLFLLVSQLIIVAASRCFCCGRPLRPGGSRACALFLFLLSWVTFIIAAACLVAGAARNAYHTKYRGIVGGEDITCQTLRKGVFAAGAAFIFFTAILTELYYIAFSKANSDGISTPPYKDSAVNMAAYR